MIVFIVGTARSGTRWLGRILAAHPAITGTVEAQPRFGMVTYAAIYPSKSADVVSHLVSEYRALEAAHGAISEKAHPALWLAEDLAEALPGARFLVIERGAIATVDSMMKHEGVRARCESGWRDYPEPCPFIGMKTRKGYGSLTIRQRCAARWHSHYDEVTRLWPRLGDRMYVISYSELVEESSPTMERVQTWLGLSESFEVVA